MTDIKTRFNLSTRELEIVTEVKKGLRNKEVAGLLFITEKTVKFHLTNIFRKLGVKSRSQMMVKVLVNDAQKPTTEAKI